MNKEYERYNKSPFVRRLNLIPKKGQFIRIILLYSDIKNYLFCSL